MGVNVIDRDGDRQVFPDATTWHVDDLGQVHLRGQSGPVATFAQGGWQAVAQSDEQPVPAKVDAEAIGREVARAINTAASRGERKK